MADLLLALDVKGKSEAVRVANACTGEVDSIKIGYPLVLSTGLGIVKDLSKADIPIIADFKVADIPNTNSLICEEVFGAGCSGIITHAFCGHDSLAACVDSAHDHGGVCFVVCEMSHPGALEFLIRRSRRYHRAGDASGEDGNSPQHHRIIHEDLLTRCWCTGSTAGGCQKICGRYHCWAGNLRGRRSKNSGT